MFPILPMTAVSLSLFVMAHMWRIVTVLKPLTVRFSPSCFYFLFCSSKYSPQHSALLKHPHIYSHLLPVKVRGSVSSNMKHVTAFSQPLKAPSFCHKDREPESGFLRCLCLICPREAYKDQQQNMRTSLKPKESDRK